MLWCFVVKAVGDLPLSSCVFQLPLHTLTVMCSALLDGIMSISFWAELVMIIINSDGRCEYCEQSAGVDSRPKSVELVWGLAATWSWVKWTVWCFATATGHRGCTIKTIIVAMIILLLLIIIITRDGCRISGLWFRCNTLFLGEFGFWDRTVGDIRPVVAVMWTGCVVTVACCLSVAAVHFELCLVSLHVFEYPLSHSVCSFVELWIHDHFADLYAPTTVWSWNRFCHHCPKLGTVCVRSVCRDYVPLNNAVNVGYRMS